MSDSTNIDDLLNYADNIKETETTFSKLQSSATKKKQVVSYGKRCNDNSNTDFEWMNNHPTMETSFEDDGITAKKQSVVVSQTDSLVSQESLTIDSIKEVFLDESQDTTSSQMLVFDTTNDSTDKQTNFKTNINTDTTKSSSQESLIVSEEEEDDENPQTNAQNETSIPESQILTNDTQDDSRREFPESQQLVRDEVESDEESNSDEKSQQNVHDENPSQTLIRDEFVENDEFNDEASNKSDEHSQSLVGDEDQNDESSTHSNSTNDNSNDEASDGEEIQDNESSKESKQPPDEEILNQTTHIFQTTPDRNSVTVGDIIRTLESKYQVPFETRVKVLIRDRLVELVSQDNESDDESDDSSSDDSKQASMSISKPKLRKRKRILKASKLLQQKEKVRKEEMGELGDDAQPLSKEDEKVMQAIADRFRTDTDELQRERKERFQSLVTKLQLKKKEAFNISIMKQPKTEESDDELEIVMDGDAVTKPKVEIATPKQEVKLSSRDALKHALEKKRIQAGNAWLARELGYKDEQEHIEDCRRTEFQRRKMFKKMQEDEKRNVIGQQNDDDEEENEELLLAKQVAAEKEDGSVASSDEDHELDVAETIQDNGLKNDDATELPPMDSTKEPCIQEGNTKENEKDMLSGEQNLDDQSQATQETLPKEVNQNDGDVDSITSQSSDLKTQEIEDDNEPIILKKRSTLPKKEQKSQDDDAEDKPQKPKNARWKALLEKESKQKQKKSSFIETEAEEEEEEVIAGLEDFGFHVKPKKQQTKGDGEEDEFEDPNDEDFSDVVDDVSDNEGDEERGQLMRTQQKAQEEKEHHKEIIRRIRDGYDGRRGNVASSLHTRGKHRLDELVAADNRETAKRLGLLVGEELEDSDDEEGGGEDKNKDDVEEDEAVLLDKMIKERFLPKPADEDDLLQGLSDDDESENEKDNEAEEDDPEKEYAKIAKRFAKQAAMNRLLEEYNDLEEFSQNKLMDEDETIRMELKSMKTVHCLKRHSSVSTNTTSISFSQSSDTKSHNSNINSNSQQTSSLFSLAVSGRKRKGTFLNSSRVSNHKKRKSSHTIGMTSTSSQHVVFHNTNTSQSVGGSASMMASSSSHLMQESGSKHRVVNTPKRSNSSNCSLWSRVSANRFRKR